MTDREDTVERELAQLRDKVDEMGSELKHISSLLKGPQNELHDKYRFFDLLREEARQKAETRLDAGMAKRCDMRPECRQRFMELLDENLDLLDRPRISEEDLRKQVDKLDALRSKAMPGRCDGCFDEVNNLFKQQTELMRQLKLFRSREEVRDSIDVLPEERVVKDLLEPLSNPQRMIILKSLNRSTRSFSELSNLTKLRGGNLLFHLQRLSTSGMISQNGGRGDYSLTSRGLTALEMVNDLYQRTSAPALISMSEMSEEGGKVENGRA